jgi:predicted transposase YdaD
MAGSGDMPDPANFCGKPEMARKFFQEHLPAHIARQVDWGTLKLHPTSFVKRTLEQSHADLVFGARMLNSDDREIRIYLLLEHQTTPDALMPLRMLGYLTEMYFAHAHQSKPALPLPAIFPFVINQSPARWNVPVEFSDLLDLPDSLRSGLAPFLPKFRYALLDLTVFDPVPAMEEAELQKMSMQELEAKFALLEQAYAEQHKH